MDSPNLILSGDSEFYNIGDVIVKCSVIHRGETYTVNIVDNDYLDNLTEDILLFEPLKLIINVSCDCDIDLSKLNYHGDLLILGMLIMLILTLKKQLTLIMILLL